MKQMTCEQCGNTVSMNDVFFVMGQSLCIQCTNNWVTENPEEAQTEGAVMRQVDPSICVQCQTDNGLQDLNQVAGLPFCSDCEQLLRNRPFPGWIKIATVMVIVLVGVVLIRNQRFFQGFLEIRQAQKAANQGDFLTASEMMYSAARHVPENHETAAIAAFYQGIHLLAQDKSAEAVTVLTNIQGCFPESQAFRSVFLSAEANAAFDRKDYDEFLTKSKEKASLLLNDCMTLATVASAYACKYASTGDEEYRQQSMQYLERASRLAPLNEPYFQDYTQRIQHRLATREIISREEFNRRYPQGWKEGNP